MASQVRFRLVLLFAAVVLVVAYQSRIFAMAAPQIRCHLPSGDIVSASKEDCKSQVGLVLPDPPQTSTQTTTAEPVPSVMESTLEERLLRLKKLYENGLINENAYKKKMDALLEQL